MSVVIIAGLIIVGIVSLFVVFSKPKSANNQGATKGLSTAVTQWKTYKSKKYGYSLMLPPNWKVEDLSSKTSRLIRVVDSEKTAFVLIEAIAGPPLGTEKDLKAVLDYFEKKFKDDQNFDVSAFTRSNEKDTGGYIATGQETFGNKTALFEERFIVSMSGRALRFHGAYTPDTKTTNKPITIGIMNSFKTN